MVMEKSLEAKAQVLVYQNLFLMIFIRKNGSFTFSTKPILLKDCVAMSIGFSVGVKMKLKFKLRLKRILVELNLT